VTIAFEHRRARVMAADLSAAALEIARRNTVRHGVADRVECVHGDLLKPLSGTFDLIVANPPYVPMGARRALQPEVRNFEPETALFGGADGLEVIRRLVSEAVPLLEPSGYLLCEFGDGQESDVSELISASEGLKMVDVKNDLQGIPRVAITRPKA
jgi:release factor glutamine methyltransferase